jgi:hypothetical protein
MQEPSTGERQTKAVYYAPMATVKYRSTLSANPSDFLSICLSRAMSENEKLDDQLRYGTNYINLPAHRFPTDQAPTWLSQ